MNEQSTDADPESPAEYASFETETGGLVIYDRRKNEAWIISDIATPIRS